MTLRQVLKLRAFRYLWLGQSISGMGDSLYAVAIAALVLEHGGGASGLGIVMGARALGSGVLLVFGGAAADRWSRASVMLAADVVRAVVVGGLALSPAGTPAIVLALGTLALGAAEAFFRPAYGAALPGLVPPEQLQAANAALSVTATVAQAAGPAAAGVLVFVASARVALLADAATFVVSWASLVVIRRLLSGPARRPAKVDLVGGLREVRQRPWLAAAIGGGTLLAIATLAPLLVLLPVIARDRDGGTGLYSVWLTAFALGSIVGAALANRAPSRRLGLYAQLGLVPVPLVLVSLIGEMSSGLTTAVLFLAGAGYTTYGVLWSTAVQRDVPASSLGRVLALDGALTLGLMPVGYAVAGYLSSAFGLTAVLSAGTVIGLAAALLPLLAPGGMQYATPSVNRLPSTS